MTDGERDDGDRGNPVWTNQATLFPKYFELNMGPRERGIHYSLAMLTCARGYVIASDPKSLCDLLNTWDKSGDNVSIEEMEALRPKLAHFFVETGDSKWTLSPTYFVINDPSGEMS
jgi:hypothetical protein